MWKTEGKRPAPDAKNASGTLTPVLSAGVLFLFRLCGLSASPHVPALHTAQAFPPIHAHSVQNEPLSFPLAIIPSVFRPDIWKTSLLSAKTVDNARKTTWIKNIYARKTCGNDMKSELFLYFFFTFDRLRLRETLDVVLTSPWEHNIMASLPASVPAIRIRPRGKPDFCRFRI